MFFEAQRRFEQKGMSSPYVRDMLKQYGNRGKPISLPNSSSFEQAAQYRRRELQEFNRLKHELQYYQSCYENAKKSNEDLQFRLDFLKSTISNVADDSGSSDSDDSGGDEHSVLPAVQSKADARQELISSKKSTNARSRVDSKRSTPIHDVPKEHSDEAGQAESTTADAGRAAGELPDSADRDMGRQTGQHGTQE